MGEQKRIATIGQYFWKIAVSAFAYAIGLIVSRITFSLLNLLPPRMPQQADESTAGYYLFAGSFILAAGITPLVKKIPGSSWLRWLIVTAFLYISFGINNPLEDSIYSTAEGALMMIPILLLPCVVLAGALVFLFTPPQKAVDFMEASLRFFKARSSGEWTWRILAAIAAFPLVYFVFGIAVSPLVADYYRQGVADLILPNVGTILFTEFVRSGLYLLAALPVLIVWNGSKRELIVNLGLALAVLGATFEIVLAFQLPPVLRVIHSLEIFTDAFVYSYLLVTFVIPTQNFVE